MIKTITLVFELLLLIAVFYMGNRFWWHRYSGLKKGIVFMLLGCATLTAISVGMATQGPTRLVTLTALNEKNENAKEASVYLEKIRVDGVDMGLPQLESGQWTIYNDRYCWFEVGDERRAEGQSDTVSFQLKVSDTAQIVFYENSWRGKVLIQIDNTQEVVDTYWDGGDKGRSVTITLPAPKAAAPAPASEPAVEPIAEVHEEPIIEPAPRIAPEFDYGNYNSRADGEYFNLENYFYGGFGEDE